MNKVLVLILSIVICISMYGCSSSETSDNTQTSDNTEESKTVDKNSEIDITGTWTQSLWFLPTKLTINSNSTFDYGDVKGTYNFSNAKKALELTPNHNNIYFKKFKYINNCFYSTEFKIEKDKEYGLPFTANDSGFTNQSFQKTFSLKSETIFDPQTKANDIELSFSENGTFSIRTSVIRYSSSLGSYFEDRPINIYEGTYKYEKNILTLTYDGKDHPLAVIDGIIYLITFSK